MVTDSYVTSGDGTGIVHQAPGFGEDDHRVAIAHGVLREDEMPPVPIDDAGKFTAEVPDFQGMYIKVRSLILHVEWLLNICFQAADKEIQKVLKAKGRLIVQSTLKHSYPFCWRCASYSYMLSTLLTIA